MQTENCCQKLIFYLRSLTGLLGQKVAYGVLLLSTRAREMGHVIEGPVLLLQRHHYITPYFLCSEPVVLLSVLLLFVFYGIAV